MIPAPSNRPPVRPCRGDNCTNTVRTWKDGALCSRCVRDRMAERKSPDHESLRAFRRRLQLSEQEVSPDP